MIRRAHEHEAPALSSLAKRSKAYWGYSAFQLDAWEAAGELTIPKEACAAGLVGVAESNDRLLGMYRLGGQSSEGYLHDLWVDPDEIGKGLGAQLLEAATKQARGLGFTALEIHSEPNAEGFYLHAGAERVGEISAPLAGQQDRVLPVLRLNIV